MKWVPLFLLVLIPCCLLAQVSGPDLTVYISGRVLDKATGRPIAYANVSNISLKEGTISNDDGFFKLRIKSAQDSVMVSFIGYHNYHIPLQEGNLHYNVLLRENEQLLDEVVVKPEASDYLADLIEQLRKEKNKYRASSKVYYNLKTSFEEKQTELVEGFYNGKIAGYDLTGLTLKNSRIAAQSLDGLSFQSTDATRAILALQLFEKDGSAPIQPLQLSRRRLRKAYYLYLDKKFKNEQSDSVYVISCIPKDTSGAYFKAKIFLNVSRNLLEKIDFKCNHAKAYPFRPFACDSFLNVNLDITKSFTDINRHQVFNYLNFSYQITYKQLKSRLNTIFLDSVLKVSTKAVLYCYNYDDTFLTPRFDFTETKWNDYVQISAFPYNSYFWEHNHELKTNEARKENDSFFYSDKTLGIEKRQPKDHQVECHYELWNADKRAIYRLRPDEKKALAASPAPLSRQYHLCVQLFLDINRYKDSTQVVTATVFDPIKSYYFLSLDTPAYCFMNIYFDLVEIERRKLEKKINRSDRSIATIQTLYDESKSHIQELDKKYFPEVQHGTMEKGMKKWNDIIYQNLGIDNLKIFHLFQKEENKVSSF
ncbi:MAG TPA: carboxypeptidase-like regulatory domain-containing protein [Flavipsychrobacter sp.]|nr:carboxypeptidase-like regulatory domain-containing protein [Flavipsychrobacter sp.]